MKAFIKNNFYYILTGIICLVLGIIIGCLLFSPKYIANNQPYISTNTGNIIQQPNLANYTNFYKSYITNNYTNLILNYLTITNILNLYADDSNYNMDSFINTQINSNKLTIDSYKRNETVILKPWIQEPKYFLGIGVDYNINQYLSITNISMDGIGGYNFNNFIGADIHASKFDAAADIYIKF